MHWYFLASGKGGGLLFVLALTFELCCLRTRKELKASVPLNLQVLVEGLSDFFETGYRQSSQGQTSIYHWGEGYSFHFCKKKHCFFISIKFQSISQICCIINIPQISVVHKNKRLFLAQVTHLHL